MIKVCKFGGTSTADGMGFARIGRILGRDLERRYVVVSAPGKRYGGDAKVTDLLYASHRELIDGGHVRDAYAKVEVRFTGIVRELGLEFDIAGLLAETKDEIEAAREEAFTVSRGEYLDPRGAVRMDAEGKLLAEETDSLLRAALKGKDRAVIAGFYGADPSGMVRLFPRGGSDITGALVARAVSADLYENWTDVSGFLACDPRIVPGPVGIEQLSFRELRELSYLGVDVLHSDAVIPVREAGIPIRILNTFRPDDGGTLILPAPSARPSERAVTGIAGKKNFTVIHLEKSLMNGEIGFAHRVLAVLKRRRISFEHIPSGIDAMSLVIDSAQLKNGALERLLEEIGAAVLPEKIYAIADVALIAVVGHGMSRNVGTSARLFQAIARAGVNVRMIDQGSSELNITVGVDHADYERTVRAVYDEFFGKRA